MKIALLPGDGIGPEIVKAALPTLDRVNNKYALKIEFERASVGGSAYDETGHPLPESTLKLAKEADAVLLGAVGGPEWESLDYSVRPERALLGLRSELELYANIRPAKVFNSLIEASALKRSVIESVDLIVTRELTGGIYFGKPKGVEKLPDGSERGFNTLVYTTSEIERIARVAFEIARGRSRRVVSVDKANVLESTELWRRVVKRVRDDEYPDIELSNLYVDNCAMRLVQHPEEFDVILTTNMFGDILSDLAAILTGSLGTLPSASLGADARGLYEPVHGSAPDIAGKDRANPIAMILSVAMMARHSFQLDQAASDIEAAVERALAKNHRTDDIFAPGSKLVSCSEMGRLIASEID